MEEESGGDSSNGGGGGEAIQVFLRLKPSKRPSPFIKLAVGGADDDTEQDEAEQRRQLPQRLAFDLPAPDAASVGGVVNNNKTHHPFTFNGIFEMDATQDDVFDRVGREAVQSALSGYNATIFAYGQTGSGKTFTITGGPARYEDRGLLPRALAMVFEEMRRGKGEVQYQVYASYLEVYNEVGYDLLDGSFSSASEAKGAGAAAAVVSLPRVTLLEDEEGNCHLRNLSMHLVGSEEEALNLLFLGDTNRAISATAMNQASSRSHCIFTLSLEGRRRGAGAEEDRVRRSKLNLVDLAGSERVHKTAARGQTLREARYINQSLFYLEMVILALHEKRAHVPYRNSMMTSVLRDSLGGNCRTVMVATVSTERAHTAESISTCRFAQRVAQVRNDARCNEEADPYQIIQRLKSELSTARAEVGYLRGEAGDGAPLGTAERQAVAAACEEFVARGRGRGRHGLSQQEGKGEDDAPPTLGKLTLSRVYHAFRVLRAMVLVAEAAGGVGMGSEQEAPGVGAAVASASPLPAAAPQSATEGLSAARAGPPAPSLPSQSIPAARRRRSSSPAASIPMPADPAVLRDPSAALAHFLAHHPRAAVLEEGKRALKAKYAEAKRLGERVAQSRASVATLRQTVEQLRRWREDKAADAAALFLDAGHEEEMALVAEEEGRMLRELEAARGAYQEAYARLRALKGEVEGAQRLVEQGRQRVQAEFEAWLAAAAATAAMAVDPGCGGQEDDEEEGDGKVAWDCGPSTRRMSASVSAASGPSLSASTTERKVGERRRGLSASSSSSASLGLGRAQPQAGGRGRDDVDDDIAAFYRAKEELLALRRQRGAGAW